MSERRQSVGESKPSPRVGNGRLCGTVVLLMVAASVGAMAQQAPARPRPPAERQKQPLTEAEYQKVVAQSLEKVQGKPGVLVRNPFAKSAQILSQLQQQKQSSDQMASRIAMETRVPVKMDPQTNSPRGRMETVNQPPQSLRTGGILAGGSTKGNGGSGMISGQLPGMNTLALTCGHDPSMRILKVGGDYKAETFTPIPQYNFYTITGCSFGDKGMNSKVYIYDKTGFQGNFDIKYWSDNAVNVELDPKLAGFLDRDNVFLVVQRADGKQAQASGYKFYAARQELELTSIPRQLARLEAGQNQHDPPVPAVLHSPVTNGDAKDAVGKTLVVYRQASHLFQVPQPDTYNLHRDLAAGWEVASVQPYYFDDAYCPGIVPYKKQSGTEHWSWDQNDVVQGTVPTTTCAGYIPPAPPYCWSPVGCPYTEHTASAYALKVLVEGPRCTDSRTGKPDQACIQKVKLGQM